MIKPVASEPTVPGNLSPPMHGFVDFIGSGLRKSARTRLPWPLPGRGFIGSGLLIRGLFIVCLAPTQANAACSRDDIDYYLDKGFSQQQITALCQGDQNSRSRQNRYRAYSDPLEKYRVENEKRRQVEEEVSFIKNALKARDIVLTPRKLEYTRKFCLAAGKTPEVEGRIRVCPNVRYRIYFKNLDIGGYERKYFFLGSREVQVTGNVKRKMLHDLAEYPSDIRRELLAAYRHATRQDGTAIPVRRDASISRVIDILRKYARRTSRAKS